MRKLDYNLEIKETVDDLLSMERKERVGMYRDRVRFIRLLKQGAHLSQRAAGQALGLKVSRSQQLWRMYREGGTAKLLGKKPHGSGWGKLDSCQMSRLQQRLASHDIRTQKEVMAWLKSEYGIIYTQSGISMLFKRLKIKLKTGRPVNIRKDVMGEQTFKKTSDSSAAPTKNVAM